MPNELLRNLGSPLSAEAADALKKNVADLAVVLAFDNKGALHPFIVPENLTPETVFPMDVLLVSGDPAKPVLAGCRWTWRNGKWQCV
jgi:hypothetical protein